MKALKFIAAVLLLSMFVAVAVFLYQTIILAALATGSAAATAKLIAILTIIFLVNMVIWGDILMYWLTDPFTHKRSKRDMLTDMRDLVDELESADRNF